MGNYPPYPNQPNQPEPYGQNPYSGMQPQPGLQRPAQPAGGNSGQAVFQFRPVMSREEAEKAQIDFLGPGLIMPNLGQGMIYLKRFNAQKGETEFLDFAYVPPPAPVQPYDPQTEISAMRADMAALQASVMALCGELEKSKKAGAKTAGGKVAEQ